jgi:geranylgeranyl diphosphate synthase type II
LADASKEDLKRLEKFGNKIGLAFQIIDDILDVEGDPELLGKTIGKDDQVQKATFPALYGLEKSREMAHQLIEDAQQLIEIYGEKAKMLHLLAEYIITRKV